MWIQQQIPEMFFPLVQSYSDQEGTYKHVSRPSFLYPFPEFPHLFFSKWHWQCKHNDIDGSDDGVMSSFHALTDAQGKS